jgi:hypothetical protein
LYNRGCTVESAPNKTFHGVESSPGLSGIAGYDSATREISAVLAVYMPVANVKRASFYSQANSTLTCLRASNFSENSRQSPALPAGKPYKYSSGLSTGVKGGIVAGVVLAVLVLAAITAWFILRRRKQRKAKLAAEKSNVAHGGVENELPPEADGEYGLHQLRSVDRKPELAGGEIVELGGGRGKPAELGDTSPAELPAEIRGR